MNTISYKLLGGISPSLQCWNNEGVLLTILQASGRSVNGETLLSGCISSSSKVDLYRTLLERTSSLKRSDMPRDS